MKKWFIVFSWLVIPFFLSIYTTSPQRLPVTESIISAVGLKYYTMLVDCNAGNTSVILVDELREVYAETSFNLKCNVPERIIMSNLDRLGSANLPDLPQLGALTQAEGEVISDKLSKLLRTQPLPREAVTQKLLKAGSAINDEAARHGLKVPTSIEASLLYALILTPLGMAAIAGWWFTLVDICAAFELSTLSFYTENRLFDTLTGVAWVLVLFPSLMMLLGTVPQLNDNDVKSLYRVSTVSDVKGVTGSLSSYSVVCSQQRWTQVLTYSTAKGERSVVMPTLRECSSAGELLFFTENTGGQGSAIKWGFGTTIENTHAEWSRAFSMRYLTELVSLDAMRGTVLRANNQLIANESQRTQ